MFIKRHLIKCPTKSFLYEVIKKVAKLQALQLTIHVLVAKEVGNLIPSPSIRAVTLQAKDLQMYIQITYLFSPSTN